MENQFEKLMIRLSELPRSEFTMPTHTPSPMSDLLSSLSEYFSLEEQQVLRYLIKCHNHLILSAKTGELESCEIHKKIVHYLIKQLNGEAKVLGIVLTYPAIALYFHKIGKNKLARHYISQVIKGDDALMKKFKVMHLHKMHHISNMISSYLADSNYKAAAKTAGAILCYFSTGKLKNRYGEGSLLKLAEIFSCVNENDIILSLYSQILLPLLHNADLWMPLSRNADFALFMNAKLSNEYMQALQLFFKIKIDLQKNVVDAEQIYFLFSYYNDYKFDILKLLVIKDVSSLAGAKAIDIMANKFVASNLNFKYPDVLFSLA